MRKNYQTPTPRTQIRHRQHHQQSVQKQSKKDSPHFPKWRKICFITLLIALIIFIVINFIYHDDFMKNSCTFTENLQGGENWETTKTIAKTLSSWLTNWISLYYLYAVLWPPMIHKETVSKHVIKSYIPLVSLLRIIFVWSLPYSLAIIEKPVLARGRPLYVCPNVKPWSCSCSFGMPSSHSCTGVSVYYTLWMLIDNCLQAYGQGTLTVIIGVVCSLFSLSIAWSRLALGSHAINQVGIGFTLGVLAVLLLHRTKFQEFVCRLLSKNRLFWVGIIYLVSSLVFTFITYFTNKDEKRVQKNWFNPKGCDNCLGELVLKQMDNNTHLMLAAGFLIGGGLNHMYFTKNERRLGNPRNSRILKFTDHLIRFGMLIVVLVPAILWLVAYFVWVDQDNEILKFIFMGGAHLYAGIAGLWIVRIVWDKMKVTNRVRDWL